MWQREGLLIKHVAKGKVTYETWLREGLLMKHVAKGKVTYETCGKGKSYL